MLWGDHVPVKASDATLHVRVITIYVDIVTMQCNAIPGEARLNGLLLSDKGFRSHIHVRQCRHIACNALSEDIKSVDSRN